MGKSQREALEALLFRFEMLARHHQIEAFGLEWVEICERVNREGFGVDDDDPVLSSTGEGISFDVSALETGGKAKSGFVGVYATTGNSFRALVPDVEKGAGSKYLTSRKTALEAAIDRYRYYDEHGLPYGNVGYHVEHWKKMRPQWSMEEIFEMLLDDAKNGTVNDLKNPYTLEQIEHTIEQHRKRNPNSNGPSSRPEPEPEVFICSQCGVQLQTTDHVHINATGGFDHRVCPDPRNASPST